MVKRFLKWNVDCLKLEYNGHSNSFSASLLDNYSNTGSSVVLRGIDTDAVTFMSKWNDNLYSFQGIIGNAFSIVIK